MFLTCTHRGVMSVFIMNFSPNYLH
jgi:hypothetical protein